MFYSTTDSDQIRKRCMNERQTNYFVILAVRKTLGGEEMNKKFFVIFGLVAISLMMVVPVFAAPQKAVGKNPNLSQIVTDDGSTWIIMKNGAGIKKTWCVDGPNEGMSYVYLDTTKLGEKAVAKLLDSGDWTPSSTYPKYIHKLVQD